MFNKIWYFYKRKIEPGFKIGKEERVIDIGSGDKPFWRGDIFFDNLELGNEQRISANPVQIPFGKFVNGNLPETPFKDKEFDFSFCAHLLEHVTDPAAVIKELMRISHRGYIEVPNGVTETMEPFHSHLWFIYRDHDSLVFYRKSKEMHDILKENGRQYHYLYAKIHNPFIRLFWDGNIKYKIIDKTSAGQEFIAEAEEARMKPQPLVYIFVVKLIRRIFYKKDWN
jgi:SAM-dependent methyltransferase